MLCRRSVATMVDHQTRWYGPNADRPGALMGGAPFPRIATICRLRLSASEQVVQVTNTHLDERSVDRRRHSAMQLLDWLDHDLPQIVVGDFNALPDDELFEPLAAAGLRHALPADAGGTYHRFTGRRDGPRIDHILVSKHFDVTQSGVFEGRVGRRLPSDHWPVRATLRLSPRAETTPRPGDIVY